MSVVVESPRVGVEKIPWISLKTEGTIPTWRARVLTRGINQLKEMQAQEVRDIETEKLTAQKVNNLLNCDGQNLNFPQTYLSEISNSFDNPIINKRAFIVGSPNAKLLTTWGRYSCDGFVQGEKDAPWIPSETGDWFLRFDAPDVDLGITYHNFYFAPVEGIETIEVATVGVSK
jgi:hypothetical protein